MSNLPRIAHNKTVVITGASAGIGRAMAFEFARRGYHLGLTARRLDVLTALREEILATCGDSTRTIAISALDVDQTETVEPVLQALFARLGGIDIMVVNAGVNAMTSVGKGDILKQKQLIMTNVIGAMASVDAAAAHFIARGAGQIVGISSLAAVKGIPKQAVYCASKAGFSMYLEAARIELKRKNISVTTIMPGFVITDIMPHIEKYPFAVSAEQAARETVTLIENKKAVGIVPGYPWRLLRPFMRLIPDSLWRKLV